MKILLASLLSSLLLLGCASNKLNNETLQKINNIGVISQIGPDFYVDTIGTTIFHNKELSFNVASWRINSQLQLFYKKNIEARSKKYVDLGLDDGSPRIAIEKLKLTGKAQLGFSEDAMRALAFESAEKAGAKYVFVITSMDRHDRYPLYRGPMGLICYDRKLRNTKASPYFIYDVSFWDIEKNQKLFHATVNPTITENIDPINCSSLKGIKERVLLIDMKTNVSDALERTVQHIFTKMNW